MKSDNILSHYLQKNTLYSELISAEIDVDTKIIVVIPCYNESGLLNTLKSLTDCDLPPCTTEVIVVINASENSEEKIINQNKKTYDECKEWIQSNSCKNLKTFIITENCLPAKHAGVGLARKIGMDEAVRRFNRINYPDGIIVCFDADSLCDENYLKEIYNAFYETETNAASIYFEHPISGSNYSKDVYEGIIQYELFLRYYRQAVAYSGFPYSYHTIGSSMAVRADIYCKQGGMNKRKAGEDFYFLQKIIPLGNFAEINTTRVIPSSRASDRVPFGTGKAIQNWLNLSDRNKYNTYSFSVFSDLKSFFQQTENIYQALKRGEDISMFLTIIPEDVQSYINISNGVEWINECYKNSATYKQFRNRFFNKFNAFWILKYVHYTRDALNRKGELFSEALELINIMFPSSQETRTYLALLDRYRKLEKNQ
jgi:hypothetical protein